MSRYVDHASQLPENAHTFRWESRGKAHWVHYFGKGLINENRIGCGMFMEGFGLDREYAYLTLYFYNDKKKYRAFPMRWRSQNDVLLFKMFLDIVEQTENEKIHRWDRIEKRFQVIRKKFFQRKGD